MKRFSDIEDEFILEAISSVDTAHGTDQKDGKWAESNTHYHTFFHHEGTHYAVALNKTSGEVGFAAKHGEFSHDPKDYSEDRTNTGNPHRVFGKVLHVVSDALKKYHPPVVKMRPLDPKLGRVYSKMLNSKAIDHHLKSHGYYYMGKNGSHHMIFKDD